VPPTLPTPKEAQAVWQEGYSEALYQLALFQPGKEALLDNPDAITALEAVAERGMTEEAKQHARGALQALRGFDEPCSKLVPKHIMLSYQVSTQLRPPFASSSLVYD
jgi:hypothetical protein